MSYALALVYLGDRCVGRPPFVQQFPGSEPAPTQLLKDLSSDRGMGWLPTSGMWFSYLRLHTTAGALTYDLAVDPSGRGRPSPVDAGLVAPNTVAAGTSNMLGVWLGVVGIALVIVAAAFSQRRRLRIAS